jgi:hypothetical protein
VYSHQTSVRAPPIPSPQVTQNGLSLVLDLAAGAFVKAGPLIDIMADLLGAGALSHGGQQGAEPWEGGGRRGRGRARITAF